MGLAETQNLVARLYTDASLRERFFADPARVCSEMGLDPIEAEQLSALSRQQVEAFAESLVSKRLGEVRDLLPLTARALSESFAGLFRAYARTYVPRGIKKHHEDAAAFAAYLEERSSREDALRPWVVDVLRYERARLVAHEPGRRCVARLFRHPVGELARALTRGELNPPIRRRPTLALWLRLTPRGPVKQLVWPKSMR